MSGAGYAILWQLWRRHRWGLSADLAYLAIAPATVVLLPQDVQKPAAGVLGFVGVAVLMHIVGAFSYGFEADLAKKESGYPSRAFVLPASNWTLTGWPAIGGAVVILAAWPVMAAGVWRQCSDATPLWWPGFAWAALLGLAQAIGWTPFSHYWMRLCLTIVIGCALAAAGAMSTALFGADERLLVALFAAAWGVCVAMAYLGVGRARRGQLISLRWLDRLEARFATASRTGRGAFRSPLRAQLWLEMRRHGRIMPLFLAAVLLCVIPVLLLPSNSAVPAWRILGIVAVLPPLLAGMVALGFGKADPFQQGVTLPQFMATRPISCARFVGAKMLAAAFTVLISCGILLAVMLPWFLRPDINRGFSVLWQGVSTWKVVAAATLGITAWIALSWRQLAGGIWVGLTGREWVRTVSSFAFASVLLLATFGGLWLSFHREYGEWLPAFIPWCLGATLLGKTAIGAWCARQLIVRRLMGPHTLGLLLIVWCAAAASVSAGIMWSSPAGMSTAEVTCGALLLVPFARLAGAPLALSFNRHR